MSRWIKIILKIVAALVIAFVLLIVGASLYITFRKDKFLKLVNTELLKNVDGTVKIGNLRPQFFKSFPNISLGLEDVLIRDKRFDEHKHTLLDAKNFDLSLNTAQLFKGTIAINHIHISNATIDLYTDSTGYSNTSLFKTGQKSKSGASGGSSATILDKFTLSNVDFKVTDQKAKKLFDFVVNDIHGKMNHPDSGWNAAFHLDVMAKSMSFSTSHGSFIKNKPVEGDFTAGYNEKTGKIHVNTEALSIGDDPFKINAVFAVADKPATFAFHIACNQLLWRHASALLSQNITLKLNQFNIANPIAVTAVISGSFAGKDPSIYVTAKVRDNTVSIPGSDLDNCSFDGVFSNNYNKSKGFDDDNSVIRLTHLTAGYHHIPFRIDTGSIINLVNPIATGNLKANFPVADLNYLLGAKIAKFSKGNANVDLRYKADIVDYRINKPLIAGSISFQNADINYIPDDVLLKNTSMSLNFVGDDLILSNIRLQTGRSIAMMNGRVKNFLNLYYSAPEKILLTWSIHSPQMYLAEFLGILGADDDTDAPAKEANSGNIITQLNNVLEKGRSAMHLEVDNLHYNKFLATNVYADLLTSPGAVTIKSIGLKTSGGDLEITGGIKKHKRVSQLAVNTTVSNVNVHDFFYGFDNFGLKDFTSENLKGTLSANTKITANINSKAAIIPGTLNGNIDISLKNAELIDFKPLQGVGKIAFPFRDLKHIRIPKLDAKFELLGDKIKISPMQVNSSILNLDIAGTYGLPKGTDIVMDVPLRNPKGDSTITDKAKLDKKRFRGIVLHLQAKADEAGKIKIGFRSKKDTVQVKIVGKQ